MYEYDQGGNRQAKIDAVNDRTVVYHYDIDKPSNYGSDNNRLTYYETFDTTPLSSPLGKGGVEGGGARADDMLLSTTWYFYSEAGNVTRIVTKTEDPPPEERQFWATRFGYAANGQAVTYIVGEEWNWDGDSAHCPTDYNISYAREFRYDQARARYLNRVLDPDSLESGYFVTLSETWSDYDGEWIYGDFEVNGSTITNLRAFEPGIAKVDPWAGTGSTQRTTTTPT